jgi:hypothetical protein
MAGGVALVRIAELAAGSFMVVDAISGLMH